MPEWFVLNLSDSPASRSERTGVWTEFEPPGGFEQYGVNVHVVQPHCPPGTRHVFVGAGDGPCAILMIGARRAGSTVEYPASEVAARHSASAAETTESSREAYRDFPPSREARFVWPLP